MSYNMSSNLTFDAVSEVLSWLPAKEVAKMQLLCRRCREDTSNDHFYLSQAEHASSATGLIIQPQYARSFQFAFIDSSSGVSPEAIDLLRSISRKIVGCCNGLIISQPKYHSNDEYDTGDLWVYNPVRRTVSILPPPHSGRLRDSPYMGVAVNFIGGFDYELICVRATEDWSNYLECKLYSTKKREWRELNNIHVGPWNMQLDSLVLTRQVLYIAPRCGSYILSEPYITSYDIEKGTSGELPMPAEVLLDTEPFIKICSWDKDSLCLIQCQDVSLFTIWILESYENASWVKIYEAKLEAFEAIYAFTVLNSKTLIVATGEATYAYDLQGKELRTLPVDHQHYYPILYSYANTLRPCGRMEGTVIKIPYGEAYRSTDLLSKCKAFGIDIFRHFFPSF